MRCPTLIILLAAMTSQALAGQSNDHQDNPFHGAILDVRPRVFIRRDDFDGLTVAKLRHAAGQPEFAKIRAKWRRRPLGQAIEWMIDGRQQDLEAALDGLKDMEVGNDTWSGRGLALVRLATLFDWLCEELDSSTRKQLVKRIENAADAAVEHIQKGQAPFYYTRTPGALAGVAISGIALKGESDKADEYLRLLQTWGVHEYFKSCEWVDGAATGATYTFSYTYVDLPQIFAAWWSATDKNPNEWVRGNQGDWLNKIVRFYQWYMRPGFAFTDINDQFRGVWSSHDQFCQGLDIASYVTGNGCGREWSQRWRGRFGEALYHTAYAHNFIFRDVSLAPKSLAEMPHAELFGRESCGYGFFRSNWPAPEQPDTATHVFFRCGDPMDVHGGVAAGEFQVFKHAPLAARSGRYKSYDSPPDQYHRNCISTNVILFTDPNDPEDRGDQNTRRGLKHDHKTWAEWLAIRQRFGHDVANIVDWRVAQREARCRADLTRANPQTKCKQWIREFVWLADEHLIVLDIVERATPKISCRWQLHSQTLPQIADHLFTIVNQAPDVNWADPKFQPRTDKARLFCQILAPKRHTVIVHSDGRADAFRSNGESLGKVAGNAYHLEYGDKVVQVDPGENVRRTAFLTVLTATEAAQTTPPKASCRAVGDGQIEVAVGGASTTLSVPDWFDHH